MSVGFWVVIFGSRMVFVVGVGVVVWVVGGRLGCVWFRQWVLVLERGGVGFIGRPTSFMKILKMDFRACVICLWFGGIRVQNLIHFSSIPFQICIVLIGSVSDG